MIKSKLTIQYIISLGLISIIIIFVNLFAGFYLVYNDNAVRGKEKELDKYTRDFEKYIEEDKGKIKISKEGEASLSKKNLWIQILDENGLEVSSYRKPQNVNTKLTPSEIVNAYKYGGSVDGNSEVLFGNKKIGNKSYTYLIAFPMKKIRKYTIVVDNSSFMNSFKSIITKIIVIDLIVAAFLGYIFSRRLTNPIKKMVLGIEELADEKKYEKVAEKGLYKSVFKQMNILSSKLEANEKERIEIQNMRRDWIANISHDIKTPLASIKGYAELMDGSYDLTEDEVKKYAEIIEEKSDYLKNLVEDLNLTMKLEDNKEIMNIKQVNIVSLVRETVIEVLNDPLYKHSNVEMHSVEDDIELELDEKLMKRAISNLVYNSLIHNEKKVDIVIEIQKSDLVEIIISDNGKGICEEDIGKVFDRYYRGTNTGEAHKGSGLGMAIVKDIVLSHNGQIDLFSKENKGVKVYIKLPYIKKK